VSKMRMILTALLMSAAVRLSAAELSADARALQQQLSVRISPAVRVWVLTESVRVHSDPQWEERRVRMDAQAQFAGQMVIGPDLDALVFLVYVEVVERLDREISRTQVRAEPTKKPSGKKAVAATNTVVEARIAQEKELVERRAKLAERTDELGRQLSPLGQTLLQNVR
jgi:hypothetical protein